MGKQGPCCHCGVTSTPLWRNGPNEKPVLCNACGSRWRTKGTLANYTPLHARAAEPDDDFERDNHRTSYKVMKKTTSIVKQHKEAGNVLKRKFDINNHNVTDYGVLVHHHPQYNNEQQGHHHYHGKGLNNEDHTSNRSSSGSAISNSDSFAQYGTADARSDLTGPAAGPVIWDSTVPSRKRTCVTTRPKAKPSPVEKLTKDLYTIWQEQQQQQQQQQSSCCLSVSSEDDLLLLTDDKPMVSVEFGHGSVLIRHPDSIAREEESEASSLPIDHKKNALKISQRLTFPHPTEVTGVDSSIKGVEKINKIAKQGVDIERTRRDEDQLEKLQILAHHNSPLCLIDLQDIVNFDGFTSQFTNDEQQRLLKFLPPVDTMEAPQRLKSMFDSPQFKENLLSFQKLLADGVFDSSLSGISIDNCQILKKLLLCTTKSKWVEQYKTFKELKGKTSVEESEVEGGFNTLSTNYSATKKRSQDGQLQKLAGAKVGMKNPKRVLMKSSYDKKEQLDDDETFLSSGKRALSLQNKNGSLSLVRDSSYFTEEGSEQDLLINLPSNSSFLQAELLLPTMSVGVQASTSSSSAYPNSIRR